ncbi:hypothetical protein [Desulfosporosinus sp. SB140]|uniref:hypothetical protein n=1 Tax=Desulfosporosinus paludis TaxID=3115649 RepID=UPI0038907C45
MTSNDQFMVQMLKSLHGRLDDMDDSSFDNTVLQFFASPYDKATVTDIINTWVQPSSIQENISKIVTLTDIISSATMVDSDIYWGSPNWSWGSGHYASGYSMGVMGVPTPQK